MTLVALVLSAMLTWVPLSEHRYYERPETTYARYTALAGDIAMVIEQDRGEPIQSREFEALLLASIAGYESFYRKDVIECRKGLGGAWSAFQIAGGGIRAKRNVCSSRREAARVALRMVRESFQECQRLAFVDRLSFYTDGRCEPRWWRSRSRVGRALSATVQDTRG
jgi:hypothetical protein